jgi:hypothetical protein
LQGVQPRQAEALMPVSDPEAEMMGFGTKKF